MIVYHGLWDYDFRKEIKVIVNMMKFLTIFQINTGKTMIKTSFSAR